MKPAFVPKDPTISIHSSDEVNGLRVAVNQTCQPEGQEIREANRPGVVGASHAPNRGAGRRPSGGPGGEAPGSSWVYENFKVKNEVIEYTIYQLFTK